MKAREFILLIIIIAAGVTFYHIHTGKWDLDWELSLFFDTDEYTFTETQEVTPPFPLEVQIINRHGDIEVQGSTENRFRIRLDKRIRRRNEATARTVAEELHLVVERDAQNIIVSSNREELGRRNCFLDFTLEVPAGMDVRIKNRYGRVQVTNVGEADIINRNGEVQAWDIARNLIIQSSYEDITVENVMLDCRVESRQAKVSINGVRGSTSVINRYGKLELNNLEKDVRVEGSHLEIFGRNLAGPLELESSYESITLIQVGATIIRGDNSPVSIESARGKVEITGRYAQVELKDIRGSVTVEGRDLGLQADSIEAEKIRIDTTYRDVDLVNFTGETEIHLSNADLSLRPRDLAHPLDVTASYCRITLVWPAGADRPLEAQSKNGEIHWGLPTPPTVNTTNGQSILKAFTDRTGPAVRLATSYADIHIKSPL
jgi:DUF4097 and DUF4098 domain-containing protein YvlB